MKSLLGSTAKITAIVCCLLAWGMCYALKTNARVIKEETLTQPTAAQKFTPPSWRPIPSTQVALQLTRAQQKLSGMLLQLLVPIARPPGTSITTLRYSMRRLGQLTTVAETTATLAPEKAFAPGIDMSIELAYVYIDMEEGHELADIINHVQLVVNWDPSNRTAVAYVAVDTLERLADIDGVKAIREVVPPKTRTGNVSTQGDLTLQAANLRSQWGYDGTGIKIGIISDGVSNLATAQASGDLPANVTVLSNVIGGDEGTAMLEIVHDLAPGAQLYFHDSGSNTIQFNSAIDALIAAGCQIVCDDIGWITQPFFEDGTVAQHVSSVISTNGIVYVSSAGNAGNSHHQATFTDGGDLYTDFHDSFMYANVPNGGSLDIVLQWDDTWGSSGNDYTLVLYDTSTWEILGLSNASQNGSGTPIEWIPYINTSGSAKNVEIDVYKAPSAAVRTIELYLYEGNGSSIYNNNVTKPDSIFGHPAVVTAIGVGAVYHDTPTAIESFSSQGPVTLIGSTRSKPDLVATDGVTVTGAGGFSNPFYGTSAAAPHVAAIAGLIWSANPAWTNTTVRSFTTSTSVDLGDAGYDNIFGNGRINALNAIGAASAPEIDVRGNSLSISDGDITPQNVDGTDFGAVLVTSGTVSKTFYIHNTSTSESAQLLLNGITPVAISGTDFLVTSQPSDTSLDGGQSAAFTVSFDPSVSGIRQATITIDNNDQNEVSYDFVIQGTGATDSTAPTVTSSTSTTADGYYKAGDAINVTVNFSEAVSSTGLTINLNSGGAVNTGVLNGVLSFSGTYTVAAGQNSPDLSINLITGTITDGANNPTTNPTVPAGQNIADSKAIVIDTTAPTVGTVTPSTLTSAPGVAQTFSAVYSDVDGFENVLQAFLLVNTTAAWPNSIGVYYNSGANMLYLLHDSGSPWGSGCTPGQSMELSNSQGTLNCAATTVSESGNNLTVNWNITPKAAFASVTPKNLYLWARDKALNASDIPDSGDWIIDGTAPTIGTLIPSTLTSAPGVAQIFSAVYSDVDGFENVQQAFLMVNTTAAWPNSIGVWYHSGGNKLYLLNDSGSSWGSGCTLGQSMELSNTQGTLSCAATTVSGSGNNLTVNWNITPAATFASATPKNLYLWAKDMAGTASNFLDSGDWTIDGSAPTVGTLTPSVVTSAPGVAQTFSAVYSDVDGYANVRRAHLLVNTTAGAAGSFCLEYEQVANKLYLLNDTWTGYDGECIPGESGSLSNTQGTLNCAATTVSGSGSNLSVNWNITPTAAFASTTPKNVYLHSRDMAGTPSGWQDRGDWTIDGTAPTVISSTSTTVNGYYKAGDSINITLTFSEAVSSTGLIINLNSSGAVNTGVLSGVPSFSGTYTVAAGQNSADLSISSITGTITDGGNNPTTNPTVPTGQNIADSKDIAIDTTAPTVGTLTPSVLTSAPGVAQTFSAVYSDVDGFENVFQAFFLVNTTAVGANSIYALYNRVVDQLYLRNDAGSVWLGPCDPGADMSLSNAQGTLNCGATTVSGSGNDLTINWNITPTAAFASVTPENIYISAQDMAFTHSGWEDKGDWTIDGTIPTVTSATSTTADGYYKAGDPINITLNFSEAVSSTGLTINLNSGGAVNTGVLSGVTSFSGTYTVAAGHNSSDLNISSITGTITDADNNTMPNPTVPAGQNIANSKAIVIDTAKPTVSISPPSASSTTTGPVTYSVTYSDTNFNSSTLAVSDVTLNRTGTADGTVNVSGAGTTRTVTIRNCTGNGTLGISIRGGTATDMAGNNAAVAASATFTVKNYEFPWAMFMPAFTGQMEQKKQ